MAIGSALAALLVLTTVGCGDPRAQAREVMRATVPTGDAEPTVDGPAQDGQSAVFSWAFDTHLQRNEYLAWATARLPDRGFTIQARDSDSLSMTRVIGGDAYRMRIDASSGAPTYVRVTLRVSPD